MRCMMSSVIPPIIARWILCVAVASGGLVGAVPRMHWGLLRLGRDFDSRNAMSTHRTRTSAAANDADLTPQVLAVWLSAFRDCFTAPAWNHVLVPLPERCWRQASAR